MRLLVLLAALLGLVPEASAQEYRKITLADGRAIVAQVESTLADGMVVRIPQGLVKVPFADVRNLEPVDSAAYASQRSWGVVVLPLKVEGAVPAADVEALRRRLVELVGYLPAVQPALAENRPVPPGKGPVEVCGSDTACAARMGVALGADAVLSGSVSLASGGSSLDLALVGTFTATPTATASTTARATPPFAAERTALFTAVQAALLLQPDPSRLPAETSEAVVAWGATDPTPVAQAAPTEPAAPKAPRPVNAARVRQLAWVPLPGLPSIAAGDGKGVALSWLLAVPASAAMVNLAGHATFTRPQLLATSVLGTAFTAIAVNHAVGLRSEVMTAITPVPGGAMLQVGLSPASP